MEIEGRVESKERVTIIDNSTAPDDVTRLFRWGMGDDMTGGALDAIMRVQQLYHWVANIMVSFVLIYINGLRSKLSKLLFYFDDDHNKSSAY